MKPQERDNLLIRIDERTINIWNVVEKQEKHLAGLNDTASKHAVKIESNSTSIKWIVRILFASGVIGGGTVGILKLLS